MSNLRKTNNYRLNNDPMSVIIPHYLQDHTEQMQHCVEEIHFLNQEASTMAPYLHYEQFQLGCGGPINDNLLVNQEKSFVEFFQLCQQISIRIKFSSVIIKHQ